jgi:hypothetical protein
MALATRLNDRGCLNIGMKSFNNIGGDNTKVMSSQPNFPEYADDLRAAVNGYFIDAQNYIDTSIAGSRIQGTNLYLGNPLGNEIEGNSQVVSSDVHDAVNAMVPELLRIFLASEKLVEFNARKPTDEDMAAFATDYINYILLNDNNGFAILRDVFMDALVRKIGVTKHYWDESEEISQDSYTGLTQEQIAYLASDSSVEIIEQTPMENANPSMFNQLIFDVLVKRVTKTGIAKIVAVPPEEFIIDRRARDMDNVNYCAHRRFMTVSELVAMGFDRDDLEDFTGNDSFLGVNGTSEELARNPYALALMGDVGATDPSMKKVYFCEHYVKFDSDDDGIAELHKVYTLGEAAQKIVWDEIVEAHPFTVWAAQPEPHGVFLARSIADDLQDIQFIKSDIQRAMLDSLAQSIHPRTAVIESQVNMDDVMNVETGAIIRMRQAGAVMPLTQDFVGQQALGVLDYIDSVKTARTGISPASQGLDPDILQSTTAGAVAATVSGAQARIEYVARNLADSLRHLGKGLLRLVVRHQDQPRVIKLRGQWIPINPADWDVELQVTEAVALGRGDNAQKLGYLQQVLQVQQAALQQLGPNNPLVSIVEVRNTLGEMLSIAGYKDATKFFKQIDPQQLAAQQQALMNQPPPVDPIIQVEQMKAQNFMQIEAEKFQIEREKMLLLDAREREAAQEKFILAGLELQLKYTGQANQAQLQALLDHTRIQADTDASNQQAHLDAAQTILQHQQAMAGQGADAEAQQQSNHTDAAAMILQHQREMQAQQMQQQQPPAMPQQGANQ